jgi:endopeptidase La
MLNFKLKISNKIPDYEKFKHKYLKYCSVQEIITLSIDAFIKHLHTCYLKFNEINNKSFPVLIKEFSGKNTNIFHWYETIKLLLLGSDENINVAGSLFALLRDKKTNICIVPDTIYDNLVFCNQMKLKKINQTLKIELDKLNEFNYESIDHKKKLASCTQIPQYVKALTMEKINEMKLNNNDYNKQLTYVKTILQFPWNSTDDNNIFRKLNSSKESAKEFILNLDLEFDKITYGHLNVKKQISLLVTKLISNPNSTGTAIGLSGPPGVGKTLIAKSLAKILDIPLIMITLGGQNDAELLIGHGYTYSGAQPGLIIRKMCQASNSRCIMYFDELDKSCTKHGSTNEITSILIHLTDPNTNKAFQDRFFQGIDFPLDKIIFVASYNDSTKIDPILLDRLVEIEVKSYTINDKIIILKDYIINELKENIGINYDIIIDENSVKRFIYEFTSESGVRDLKHKIEQVLLNINKDILIDKLHVENSIRLDYDLILNYLQLKDKNINKRIPDYDQIGYVNGLYATSTGNGGITSIEICQIKTGNDFQLKLTGSMGDIMKESIQVAFSQACNYICNQSLILDLNAYIKERFPWGFHIHTPEGATPKDGPSAGGAFTIGFISVLLEKKVKRTVALTGEMNLSGNITKIGGLIYKLIGAKHAGVKTVLIPTDNKIDIEEIILNYSDLFDDKFNYIYVNNILDIVKYIFD